MEKIYTQQDLDNAKKEAVDGYKAIHQSKLDKVNEQIKEYEAMSADYKVLKEAQTKEQIKQLLVNEKVKPEHIEKAMKYGNFTNEQFKEQIKTYRKDFADHFETDNNPTQKGTDGATVKDNFAHL